MAGPDDDALMAGMAAGDRESAALLVRRYQRRVFGLALTVIGDPASAEDIAQETFTRAWRHAANYDSRRGSAATWLLTIARNLAIDAVRVRRSDPVDPSVLSAMVGASPEPEPADRAVAAGEGDILRRALLRLPEEQRRAVVLAAIGGRTGQEISESERIPLGTAKTRIRNGLLRLRADLAGDVVDLDGDEGVPR